MSLSRNSKIASADRRLTARGAATRAKALQATISCIVRSGFAALTIEDVMAESGISRGSILHQFPNRLALAIETMALAMRSMVEQAHDRASQINDPFERLAGYAEIIWETHSSAEGLALTDILQVARWDSELARGIHLFTRQAEEQIATELEDMARDAGFREPRVMVARGWLLVASARGLIIESQLGYDRPMIHDAVEEMKRSHRRFCAAMVAPPVELPDRIASSQD